MTLILTGHAFSLRNADVVLVTCIHSRLLFKLRTSPHFHGHCKFL